MAMDAEGHIYLAGEFVDELYFGNAMVSGKGEPDIFVARFNSDGKQAWLRSWGSKKTDRPRSIAVDDKGNFFLTAYFTADPKVKGKNITGENLLKCSSIYSWSWNMNTHSINC